MFGTLASLGIACLLVPVFAKYAEVKSSAEKGFSLIAGAGVLFILAQAFEVNVLVNNVSQLSTWGSMLFQVIGWIFVLVGAIWAAWKLAVE